MDLFLFEWPGTVLVRIASPTAEAVQAYRRALDMATSLEEADGRTARSEGWPLRGEAGRKLGDDAKYNSAAARVLRKDNPDGRRRSPRRHGGHGVNFLLTNRENQALLFGVKSDCNLPYS